jgi:hypothetical protein
MSYKEELDKLKIQKQEREKAYIEFKGMLKGARATGKLNKQERGIFQLLESMTDEFKGVGDAIDNLWERDISLSLRVESLEKQVGQLKTTLDTFTENR